MGKMISVVIPVYNEEAGIKKFLEKELLPTLAAVKYDTEIVIVNDGSTDRTLEKIESVETNIPLRVISFSRNFGKEIALTAGLKESKGDAVIMIDSDGQHPVEAIPVMIDEWEKGANIVTAINTGNTTKHKIGSKVYHRMMKMLGNKGYVPGAMDFRLLDRVVVDEFDKFTERNRLTRGLVDWLGFDPVYIKVQTKGRIGGKPTYSFKKLASLAGDSLASSSRTPLMIFGYIGAFIMIGSFFFGLFILIQQYIMGDPLGLDWSGAVAMSVFVSFLVGLVLVSQAITALYISQIHIESKDRPLYVINKKKSFELGKKK